MSHTTTKNIQTKKQKTAFKASLVLITSLLATSTFAADSAHHTSQAGKHSALAVSHGAKSTAKVASAVVAVPVAIAGGAMLGTGIASAAVGSKKVGSTVALTGALGISAAAKAIDSVGKDDKLLISDVTITADPAPQKVMQKNTVKTTRVTTTHKTTTTMTKVKEQK